MSSTPTTGAAPLRGWAPALVAMVVLLTMRAFGPALSWGFTDADAWADVAWARHPLGDQLLARLTGGVGGDNANFWRPAVMIQFWIERAAFGWAPLGWHAWDLAEHVVATLLLARFVHQQATYAGLPPRPITTLVTLLFVVHPLAEEIVPAVARNIDLLLGVGVFGALAALVEVQRRRRDGMPWGLAYGALLMCVALALGAKESGALLVPLAAAWILLFREDLTGRARLAEAARVGAPLAALLVGYLAVRTYVM